MGFGILFVIGLITSIYCIAMCGDINLSQCMVKQDDDTGDGSARFTPSFLYNMGRVVSYTETPYLTPQQDFSFECGMGMLQGYVKVVNDLNKVDLQKIRKEFGN